MNSISCVRRASRFLSVSSPSLQSRSYPAAKSVRHKTLIDQTQQPLVPLHGRWGSLDQTSWLFNRKDDVTAPRLSLLSFKDLSLSSDIPQKYGNFSGISESVAEHILRFSGNLGMKLGIMKVKDVSPLYLMSFRNLIHSVSPKEFEMGRNSQLEMGRNSQYEMGRNSQLETRRNSQFEMGRNSQFETGRNSRSMNFVKGTIGESGTDIFGGSRLTRYATETNADIVHIRLNRNNTFVTLTDSKGNIKTKVCSGMLKQMKGGAKVSRYAAEATAEEVGRLARKLGSKSVVVKVNGFTHFKKKKQAILSWREGFTHSQSGQNPIMYIEDTTRRPHNGCRLRKQRRI